MSVPLNMETVLTEAWCGGCTRLKHDDLIVCIQDGCSIAMSAYLPKLTADLATSQATVETLWRCLIEAAKPDGNLCQLLRERNLERACKALGVGEE